MKSTESTFNKNLSTPLMASTNTKTVKRFVKEKADKTLGEELCRPFKNWRQEFNKQVVSHGGAGLLIGKWMAPACLAAFLLYLCMVLLHVGTYYYVNNMKQWNLTYAIKAHPGSLKDAVSESQGVHWNDPSFGSLNDPGAEMFGKYHYIGTGPLDKIAALFPALFVFLTIVKLDLRLWTKVFLCHGLLAIVKGLCGAMTTVNDSAGWEVCHTRLGEKGVDWMNQKHDFIDFLLLDLKGTNDGTRLRWCADMMYSGHTYTTCLYALALYELCRIWFRNVANKNAKMIPVLLICIVTCGEQALEIYCVLISHFHYSMDVFMAILCTFLFYTNGVICVFAKRWNKLKRKYTFEDLRAAKAGEANTRYQAKDIRAAISKSFRGFQCQSDGKLTAEELEKFESLLHGDGPSSGDVLVPVCCFPFCCWNTDPHSLRKEWVLGSTEHVFTDSELIAFLERFKQNEESMQQVKKQLHMEEGVHLADLTEVEPTVEGNFTMVIDRQTKWLKFKAGEGNIASTTQFLTMNSVQPLEKNKQVAQQLVRDAVKLSNANAKTPNKNLSQEVQKLGEAAFTKIKANNAEVPKTK